MNRLVWKLLRQHISIGQLSGFFLANIFGMAGIAGLNELLGDDTLTAANQFAGQKCGAIRLSGIRIDAADKINVVFHCFEYYIE